MREKKRAELSEARSLMFKRGDLEVPSSADWDDNLIGTMYQDGTRNRELETRTQQFQAEGYACQCNPGFADVSPKGESGRICRRRVNECNEKVSDRVR